MTFIEYCTATNNYLKRNTAYQTNKETISACFNVFKENSELIRLVIIDSMYSTNLSKRLFGFEDISQKLKNIGPDEVIIAKAQEYLRTLDSNSIIGTLLSEKIGINKTGKPEKTATSLITKYLYYLTKYNFPIFDSLVNDNIDFFISIFCSEKRCEGSLFKKIQHIKNEFKISYDLIDNGIWFYGKMQKGSLSLIVQKETYVKLIQYISIPDSIAKSNEIDNFIKELLLDKELDKEIEDIIGNELYQLLLEVRKIRLTTAST